MSQILSPTNLGLIFGISASIATFYGLPGDNWLRVYILGGSIILIIACVLSTIATKICLQSAWENLCQLRHLGIQRIYPTGDDDRIGTQIENARKIRMMYISGNIFLKRRKKEFLKAITEQKALIRVLVAAPKSNFVSDIEEIESSYRLGQISPEITNTEALLKEYMIEAVSNRNATEIGSIEYGYYTTHLRSSLILCDENKGWITLNLPPKRSAQSVTLELSAIEEGLLKDCIDHFDKCWQIAEKWGRTHVIQKETLELSNDNTSIIDSEIKTTMLPDGRTYQLGLNRKGKLLERWKVTPDSNSVWTEWQDFLMPPE